MANTVELLIDNDQRLTLVGLVNQAGDKVSDATVTVTLLDKEYNVVAGIDKLDMAADDAEPGSYRLVIGNTTPLTCGTYTAKIVAVSGELKFSGSTKVVVTERTF